jgi:cell division protein FtsL
VNAYVREYQKIENKTRRRDNFLLRYLPILLLLGAGIVAGKIYLQSVAIRWSRELIERNEDARDLELQNQELTRTIAALKARSRVAREASERLGMVVPREQDVVWLPVADRGSQPTPVEAVEPERGPKALVNGWLDALWQEEALALTSQ